MPIKSNITLAALLAVSLYALTGCGGTGGTNNTPSTTLRLPQAGDTWTLSLTGTNGSTYVGNASTTVTSGTYNGQSVVEEATNTVTTSPVNETLSLTTYLAEAAGVAKTVATTDSSGTTTVSDTGFSIDFTIGKTSTETVVDTPASGPQTTTTTTYTVTGIQQVTTPAGTFDCWVINAASQTSLGTSGTFTLYIDPSVGVPIKTVTPSLTTVLTATNILHY